MITVNRNITLCTLIAIAAGAHAGVTVGVDSSQPWQGYMNVSELPANGGAFDFGSGWSTGDLPATFAGTTLTLTPNTNIDRDNPNDAYWWTGNAGNHNMEANMYVQNDALAGQDVTFSGSVISNSLVAPYTAIIFVKDLVADYSSSTVTSVPLAPGPFSIHLQTTVGDHVQYGFATTGPNARLATVASLGSAKITAISSPVQEVTVGLDPAQNWVGYMNWSELPANGGAYDGGGAQPIADLPATFDSSGVLTLTPNISIERDNDYSNSFWWAPSDTDPTGYVGNKNLEALFYVQDDTTLPGKLVHFTANGLVNSLVTPYTCKAFIRDFAADYSSYNEATTPVVNGSFTVTLQTHAGGRHTQYGFDTLGPNAHASELASLGQVKVGAVPAGFTLADAVTALKEWGGLQAATQADETRLDIETGTGIKLNDVTRLVRKVSGKDTNP